MNLKGYMDQQGITEKQLCENPGVSESTLKRALKGNKINDNSTNELARL